VWCILNSIALLGGHSPHRVGRRGQLIMVHPHSTRREDYVNKHVTLRHSLSKVSQQQLGCCNELKRGDAAWHAKNANGAACIPIDTILECEITKENWALLGHVASCETLLATHQMYFK
jgi:hypothetical protein